MPNEKAAWNCGMMLRPILRSTTAPSAFMATLVKAKLKLTSR